MADSDFAIANLALLKIGETDSLLGSLDDPSNQAVVLNLLYAQKRDELLRSYRWPWAQRRAYPEQLGGSTWVSTAAYAQGAYVSYAPSVDNVVNPPEWVSTFVYMALSAVSANPTGNTTPDSSPTVWRQISRAAWAYCFVLPTDVLKVHDLYHAGLRNPREDQHIPYDLGYEPAPGPGTILLTDAGLPWETALAQNSTPVSIELEYTAQITDVKQFPPDFVQALAWSIAAELCLALRKDGSEAQRCSAAATAAIGEAVANAKQEIRPDPEPLPSWITSRRTLRGGRGW